MRLTGQWRADPTLKGVMSSKETAVSTGLRAPTPW